MGVSFVCSYPATEPQQECETQLLRRLAQMAGLTLRHVSEVWPTGSLSACTHSSPKTTKCESNGGEMNKIVNIVLIVVGSLLLLLFILWLLGITIFVSKDSDKGSLKDAGASAS